MTSSVSPSAFPFFNLPLELQHAILLPLLTAPSEIQFNFAKPYENSYHKWTWCWTSDIPPARSIPPIQRCRNCHPFNPGDYKQLEQPKPCYHNTINANILLVCRNFSALVIPLLYAFNTFRFPSAREFNIFTEALSVLAIQSLRHVVLEFPAKSFQVASLDRLILPPANTLALQVLDLNFSNYYPLRWMGRRTRGKPRFSQAAPKFIDLVEGRRTTASKWNGEILDTIRSTFEIDTEWVQEQEVAMEKFLRDSELACKNGERKRPGEWYSVMEDYCRVRMVRKGVFSAGWRGGRNDQPKI